MLTGGQGVAQAVARPVQRHRRNAGRGERLRDLFGKASASVKENDRRKLPLACICCRARCPIDKHMDAPPFDRKDVTAPWSGILEEFHCVPIGHRGAGFLPLPKGFGIGRYAERMIMPRGTIRSRAG